MERMKVPFGWQVWGWFTLLASLGIHGFLLSLPMSFSLDAPEPEPESIAAVPLRTLPEIPSPPPEPLVSDGEVSPTSEVMSIAEVYEPEVSAEPEVIQAVEVYEPEVSPPSEVDIESESFDRTLSVLSDRNPQLPVQPAVDLEELRQQKIQSMKEQAAQSSESPIQNQNPENTPLNSVSEMFAQMDTDLEKYLSDELDSDDRQSYKTEEEIIALIKSLSLDNDDYDLPENILEKFLLDSSGNYKEGIIADKLRLIIFSPDVQMTAEQIYQNAIEPTIDLEEYQIQNLLNVRDNKVYEVEKITTSKLPEDRNFYIQLIMTQSPILNQKIAAIVVWSQQPEPLSAN